MSEARIPRLQAYDPDEMARRGRHGAEKRWAEEGSVQRPVYHPLHDNPRLKALLGRGA